MKVLSSLRVRVFMHQQWRPALSRTRSRIAETEKQALAVVERTSSSFPLLSTLKSELKTPLVFSQKVRHSSTSRNFLWQLPPEERAGHVKLLVCDMAGTTIDEGGLVYTTLQKVMNDAGLEVSNEEMLPWHGAQKTEVVAHFVQDRLLVDRRTVSSATRTGAEIKGAAAPLNRKLSGKDGSSDSGSYYSFRPWSSKYREQDGTSTPPPGATTSKNASSSPPGGHQHLEALFSDPNLGDKKKLAAFLADKIDQQFETEIADAYFQPDSPVRLIDDKLLDSFANLRSAGLKIALNTGYPAQIQQKLIEKLRLGNHIDTAVCAGDVPKGRPYPYMTQLAMQQLGILDVATVAKAGDTARDVEEGLNCGCGLAIGVLSGAGQEPGLRAAGADLVLENVCEFEKLVSPTKKTKAGYLVFERKSKKDSCQV
ncbi:unnamed protein product [Amoebophrya sp. A120]|nr:unnamed protein product [Amoebophrya sp. A120]|eukprot:GSA120T00005810001.1